MDTQQLRDISDKTGGLVERIAFHPDGKVFLTWTSTRRLQLWDAQTGKLMEDWHADTTRLRLWSAETRLTMDIEPYLNLLTKGRLFDIAFQAEDAPLIALRVRGTPSRSGAPTRRRVFSPRTTTMSATPLFQSEWTISADPGRAIRRFLERGQKRPKKPASNIQGKFSSPFCNPQRAAWGFLHPVPMTEHHAYGRSATSRKPLPSRSPAMKPATAASRRSHSAATARSFLTGSYKDALVWELKDPGGAAVDQPDGLRNVSKVNPTGRPARRQLGQLQRGWPDRERPGKGQRLPSLRSGHGPAQQSALETSGRSQHAQPDADGQCRRIRCWLWGVGESGAPSTPFALPDNVMFHFDATTNPAGFARPSTTRARTWEWPNRNRTFAAARRRPESVRARHRHVRACFRGNRRTVANAGAPVGLLETQAGTWSPACRAAADRHG